MTATDGFAAPPAREAGFLPLSGYALLGDGRGCALAGCDGAVDWWPLRGMHATPAFAALLDPDRGGRLTLRPDGDFEVRRSYADGGAVLVTEFRTATGAVRITDALNLGAGSLLPWPELARRVDGLTGEVALGWEVHPGTRFETTAPWAHRYGDQPLIGLGGQQLALVLDGAGEAECTGGGFRGRFTVSPGATALLAVVATDGEPTPVPTPAQILRRLDETCGHWARWRELVDYAGPWRDAVVRSAIVHKQLTLAETGALQAAATTSLPERVGGSRNFDYRFSWARDTAFALAALTRVELRGEVQAALSFLLREVQHTAPEVSVLYPMTGGQASADMAQVALWRGYRDSRPVHVGNNAAAQFQLGSYGDLLEAVGQYARHGGVLDGATGRLAAQIADRVCVRWREDDAGLWELGEQRPYTSSKIAAWAALDRAVRLAEDGQVPGESIERWRVTAEEIHAYVDEVCWSESKRSFTFYAGSDDLDCACLLVARTGFVAGDDPRLGSTIDAVRRELSAGGPLLYRYAGMRDEEGAFAACSFWLVEALCAAGRLAEARELMDAMVAMANDVGLFGEEVDPDTGQPLGNFPQALSHLALINAAVAYGESVSRG